MRAEQDPGAALTVVVIQPDAVRSYGLPETGVLVIGRAEDCDIQIDDPQISRAHVQIRVTGDALEVEDLGSANGTRLGGQRLHPHAPVPLSAGDVVDVGETMIVLQRAPRGGARRHLWSHAYLEVRLEEECGRSTGGPRAPFALVRVQVAGEIGQARLEQVLTSGLGRGDLVAAYAPGEYEILLVDTARTRAEHVADTITVTLGQESIDVRIGLACFPEDGLTPQALLGAANAELFGPQVEPDDHTVVVDDPKMRELYRVLDRVARGRISVLLLGETGVGKEVIAEALHTRSPRTGGPFVRLNCAALSETLVESELFGYERGAFTGADRPKAGLLEAADGGTIFLDEVGELPLSTQAKLLRVLELREVRRVGGVDPTAVDVRVVAATNRDLEGDAERGTFRRDLYYRLNGVSLIIPPLRDRPSEVPLLVKMFASRAAADLGLRPPKVAPEALTLLVQYAWPGNIRELRNVIERAMLLSGADCIDVQHLPIDKLSTHWSVPPAPASARGAADSEKKRRIVAALDRCAGNQTRAARALGVSRQTLSKWLDRYDIPRPRKS